MVSTRVLAVSSVSLVALVALVALVVACGGTVQIDPPEPTDAAATGDGSAPLDAPPAPTSPPTPPGPDATVVRDATTADAAPEINKDAVTCGAVECTRTGDGKSRQICCVTPGSPPTLMCTPELDPGACTTGRRECDDSADCGGTGVCCAETRSGNMTTRCLPSCETGAPRWQVCKTTAECQGGIPCTHGICPRQGKIGFCVGAAIPDGCR